MTVNAGILLISLILFSLGSAQTPGALEQEVHPPLTTWKCSKDGGCVKQNSYVVLDASSHWIHQANHQGCGDWGSGPNTTACPDVETCAKNCFIEGISNYSAHGVSTKGSELTLHQLVGGALVNPRVFILAEDQTNYEIIKLSGGELSFDVDVSKLPCGMNGALYLVEMLENGGFSSLNQAGAKYGTGYCDAQCYVTPWVNGVGNVGKNGVCCAELDIWEANWAATQLAPHPCNKNGVYLCSGDECGFNGVCDQWGCGDNPYTLNNPEYYGHGSNFTIDTSRPFTVVTQFPADEQGKLKEIRRLYVQNGRVFQNAVANVTGAPQINYLTDEFCNATAGEGKFIPLGGMGSIGGAMSRGMVLAMSIWWSASDAMNWLDSDGSGPCNATEGNPTIIQQVQPDPVVTYSNIKWGDIGSTFQP